MSKLSFDRHWNYVQRYFLTNPRFTVDGIPFSFASMGVPQIENQHQNSMGRATNFIHS